jgi:hypothetical protein
MIIAGIYDSIAGRGGLKMESLGTPNSIILNMHYDAAIDVKDNNNFWHRFYYIDFMIEDECIMFYPDAHGEDTSVYRSKELEKFIDKFDMEIRPNIRIVTYGDNEKDDAKVNIFLHASEAEVKALLKYIRHVKDGEPIIFNSN